MEIAISADEVLNKLAPEIPAELIVQNIFSVQVALNNAPFGFAMLDVEGRYLYVNAIAAELNGLAPEAHIGRRSEEILPSIGLQVAHIRRQVFETGEPVAGFVFMAETPAHPGEERWWRTSYYPIVVGGEVRAVAAYFNDETEIRRVELAHQEVEARFLSFMNNLPGAAWMKDRDGRYVYANAANQDAMRIFKTPDGSVGKRNEDFLPEATAREFEEHDRQALAGNVVRAIEVLPKNDGNHSYLVAKFPVAGVGGEANYIGGMAVDITDRVKAEEMLEEKSRHLEKALVELDAASRVKDDFIGMVSHELRTPITTILGNASVLVRRQNTLSPRERFESVSDLLENAKRLNQVVENLLVLARLERGKEVEAEPVLVSRAVKRLLQEARKSNSGRRYRFRGVSHEPIASGVEVYIEQVLRNYLSNAAKFSDSSTRIDVTLRACLDEICVRVLDRGAGLDHEDFENVFEPFFRSEKTAETTSGVGIGLTVCKRLIEAQGGRVWASARPGGGMEFGFSVPVAADEL